MKDNKWERRERKQRKAKNGMRIDGSSIKIIVRIIQKKAEKVRKDKGSA